MARRGSVAAVVVAATIYVSVALLVYHRLHTSEDLDLGLSKKSDLSRDSVDYNRPGYIRALPEQEPQHMPREGIVPNNQQTDAVQQERPLLAAHESKQASAAPLADLSTANKVAAVAFYYPWYGTRSYDGEWSHWDHSHIPHWDKKKAAQYPPYKHQPPDDLGASFYPQLGPYSSRDPDIIATHMQQVRSAGIDAVAVSWYPPSQADDNGEARFFDQLLPSILDIAFEHSISVCIHVEPFQDRNAHTIRAAVAHIMERYGSHPALATYRGRPVLFFYDSYQVPDSDWAAVFATSNRHWLQAAGHDVFAIGLLTERNHQNHILRSGFDGLYTYFATDGFTFGSTYRNWASLVEWASERDLLFVPCVGPGYDDTAVRPWNEQNTREREHGRYYEKGFASARKALKSFRTGAGTAPLASVLGITSFNEWHEGTQIEPAKDHQRGVQKSANLHPYKLYERGPSMYLDLTRRLLDNWRTTET